MGRTSRWISIAALLLSTWLVLADWESDPPPARVMSAAFSAWMLTLALGLASPRRFVLALRVVAGTVAIAYVAYFATELVDLLRGVQKPFIPGRPSALMAGIGLLVFGVPALVFALGGVPVGIARSLERSRDSESDHDRAV